MKNFEIKEDTSFVEIENFIADGGDVNSKVYGRPLLFWAALKAQDSDIVGALIKAGADVNAKIRDGWTPLMWAAGNVGTAGIVSLLLEAGADANAATEEDGTTALIWAAQAGNAEAVRALLSGGADPFYKDKGGKTAYCWGLKMGKSEANTLLQDAME